MDTNNKNHHFLSALNFKKTPYTPVWIMRQAGRYLPEYRQIREKAGSFMSLCTTPELACEVTLQPLKRFDLDAAILFSDILTIPDAMGLGLYFIEGEGPKFKKPINSIKDIEKLPIIDVEDKLKYVMDAVRLIRGELNNKTPLIGFSGSPWTLSTYMIEGQSSRDFAKTKKMLYNEPKSLHLLLEKLSTIVAEYLNCQIKNGAQAVQIFDTWGGVLSPDMYDEFSLPYMAKIIKKIKDKNPTIPIIIFSKNVKISQRQINTGCNAIGLDWTSDIKEARTFANDKVALQGNLDPAILYADESVIEKEVSRVLEQYGTGEGHIFNLGHGITPEVDPDKLKFLVDTVHNLSAKYHS
ncbi:MAG: uroporphyrinogen decarboxylase [Gammaproteobacteria bacterium]|nr:MAG: uroporphyrinogen decarboxylase [Gammaproteobacteria bacterium]